MGPTRSPLRRPRKNQSQSEARGKDLAGPPRSAHLAEVRRLAARPQCSRPRDLGLLMLQLSSRKDPDKPEELRRQTKSILESGREAVKSKGFQAPLATVGSPRHLQQLSADLCCGSVTQLSLTLPPHGLKQARLPCPSPYPGVCPGSCSLHHGCSRAISSSDAPFSFCPRSFPASGSFPVVVRTHVLTKTVK